jgi:hypothetical protein
MRYTVIFLSICFAVAVIGGYLFSLTLFWGVVLFFILIAAGVINGILADWEDNNPGGFMNPDPAPDKKKGE